MDSEPISPTSNKPVSLAKLATIFAVVFGVTFGLCSVTAISGGFGSQGLPFVMGISAVIEAVCLLGLIWVGILSIVRQVRKKSQK